MAAGNDREIHCVGNGVNEWRGMATLRICRRQSCQRCRLDIERMKIEKQVSERAAVKQQLIDIAKKAGFELRDLFGKGGKEGQRRGEVPRSEEPGEHVDRPRTSATVDGCCDEGREGEERGFPDWLAIRAKLMGVTRWQRDARLRAGAEARRAVCAVGQHINKVPLPPQICERWRSCVGTQG